jgi:hypothetical protein
MCSAKQDEDDVKSFTEEDVTKIVAEDKRFGQQYFELSRREDGLKDHMAGIRDCMIVLSTIRKAKKPSTAHRAGCIKHIVEDITGRYTWPSEVLIAAKLLDIQDDGTDYPYFYLHTGDLKRLRMMWPLA